MVDEWQIEWNSSMIQHGAGIGTVEFILEKGGNLSDINYVMFDAYNDDTWEPLIKAVAEKENSHPDIIRKNMQMQQPYGVAGKHGQYNPAQPMNVTQGAGQNVTVGVRNPKEFRQQRRLESAFRGRNDPQNASFLDNMRAGNRLQAFKNLVPKAGSETRMGRFMQGAGDTLRHGAQAFRETREENRKGRENRSRASYLERNLADLANQRDIAARETGGSGPMYDNRMQNIAGSRLGQKEGAYSDELDKLRQEATAPKQNVFGRITELGEQRRGNRMSSEELDAERRRREAETTTADVQEQMAENPEAEQAAMQDATQQGPATQTPKETQVNPTKVKEEVIDPFNQPADGAPVEAPADDGIDEGLIDRLVGEGGTYTGKRNRGYREAAKTTRNILNNPEKFKTADDVRSATGSKGKRDLLANAIIEHMGLTPAQAEQVVQAAEQGNPEAKEIVQEAEEVIDPFAQESELVNFSSDKHVQSWDALMKEMNLR